MPLRAKCCLSLTCKLQLRRLFYIVCPRPCLLRCQSPAHPLWGLEAKWDTSFQKSVLSFNDKSQHTSKSIWQDYKLHEGVNLCITSAAMSVYSCGCGVGREGSRWLLPARSALVPLSFWPCYLLNWSHRTPRLLQTVFAGDCSLSSPGRCSLHPPFSSLTPSGQI